MSDDMARTAVANIRARSESGSRERGVRSALVVQGGGMRGIYSAGAMQGLAEAGLSDAFDHVFGSSSGAINGAYLLAGQTGIVAAGYADHLNKASPFIKYRRLRKIVDIDYLVDAILKNEGFPLAVKRVVDSRTLLHTVLTEYETGEPVVITSKEVQRRDQSGGLFYEVLRGTSALPVLYNRPVEIAGRRYMDGGIVDAIPLLRALEAGCTDILVVITRKPGFRRHSPKGLQRAAIALALAKHPKRLRNTILREDARFNQTMALIQDPSSLEGRVNVAVIHPSDERRLASRTTRDRGELWDCAKMGREDTLRILDSYSR